MKDIAGWFNDLIHEAPMSAPDDTILIAIGSAADEGGDTSMRKEEGYEDFERRRFRAMGLGVMAAIEAAELQLVSTREDAAKLEKVARVLARAQVEYEAAEAEFQFAKAPDGKPLDIDMDAEIEAMWPDYLPAARAAISAFLGKEE